ncbi:MAG: membrane protein insertion efficiency factor YidD [Clostridia bacterium]
MKNIFIFLVKFYKKYISPRKRYPTCRFIPTCSSYALTALEEYGALKGGLMSLWRILRCNPFCKGGYDPVPLKKENDTLRLKKFSEKEIKK